MCAKRYKFKDYFYFSFNINCINVSLNLFTFNTISTKQLKLFKNITSFLFSIFSSLKYIIKNAKYKSNSDNLLSALLKFHNNGINKKYAGRGKSGSNVHK